MVLFAMLMGVGTFGVCYAIALSKGMNSYFLSSSISSTPESNLGVVGLVPAILCLPFIGLVRYQMVSRQNSSGSDKHVERCNLVSLGSCSAAAAGGFGVCAFPSSSVILVHFFFAVIFFIFSLVVSIVNVAIDRRLDGARETLGAKIRVANVVVGTISLVGLGALGLVILILYSIDDMPDDIYDSMTILELVFFAATMNVFGSFYFDFKGTHLQVGVVMADPPCDMVTEVTKNALW